MKPAAALLWSIAICLTLDGAAFGADPRAAQLTNQPWTKGCTGSICFVATEARGRCMPSGGWVLLKLEDGKPVSLSSSFFTKSGNPTVLRVDADNPMAVPDQTCLPSGLCINKLAINDDLIARLKRAQTITIEATSTTGERLALSFSLAGFARAYDGPGLEPKVYEEIHKNQKSLKEALREPPPCED
jgi:invasion associated locus B (IalB) protein